MKSFLEILDTKKYLPCTIDVKAITDNGFPNLEIIFKPLPQDDPLKRQPDITKAKSQIGWEPHTSLDKGLDKTISWFKKLLVFLKS